MLFAAPKYAINSIRVNKKISHAKNDSSYNRKEEGKQSVTLSI